MSEFYLFVHKQINNLLGFVAFQSFYREEGNGKQEVKCLNRNNQKRSTISLVLNREFLLLYSLDFFKGKTVIIRLRNNDNNVLQIMFPVLIQSTLSLHLVFPFFLLEK